MEGKGGVEYAQSILVKYVKDLNTSLLDNFPFPWMMNKDHVSVLSHWTGVVSATHPGTVQSPLYFMLWHHRGMSPFLLSGSSAVVSCLQTTFLKWVFFLQQSEISIFWCIIWDTPGSQPNYRVVGRQAWRCYTPQSDSCSWADNPTEGLGWGWTS